MRSDVIRIYKSLHTWTGLISGMALFICFYAGALSMFKEPLSRWSTPPAEQQQWVQPEQWKPLIQTALARHPEAADAFILHVEPREHTVAPMVWANGEPRLRVAPQGWATLDEAGELITGESRPAPLAELIDLLHQTAGIPGGGHHYLGVYIMGAVCVLYFLALVSGLIVLLPTLVKDLFAVRPGHNRKRFWLDTHNVIGLASLPFHLVIALSTIVFAFHDQIYDGLQKLVYADRPLWERSERDLTPRSVEALLPPAQLLEQLTQIAPDFEPREIHFYDMNTAAAEVRVYGETLWQPQRDGARGLAIMDPYSGEITSTAYLPGHENDWTAIINTFFALHFGNYGGAFTQWAYLLLGLGGAFLFYSGNLLWVETRRRRQRGSDPVTQKATTAAMAAATVGVCWGTVAGISSAVVVGKWLTTTALDMQTAYLGTYYCVFLGAVAWAFCRGAAAAAVDLLWLSAATTLAIPLTGALALVPGIPVWLHLAPELLVEASALVFGITFAWMARRTARHLASNNADTVWSVTCRPAIVARQVEE